MPYGPLISILNSYSATGWRQFRAFRAYFQNWLYIPSGTVILPKQNFNNSSHASMHLFVFLPMSWNKTQSYFGEICEPYINPMVHLLFTKNLLFGWNYTNTLWRENMTNPSTLLVFLYGNLLRLVDSSHRVQNRWFDTLFAVCMDVPIFLFSLASLMWHGRCFGCFIICCLHIPWSDNFVPILIIVISSLSLS